MLEGLRTLWAARASQIRELKVNLAELHDDVTKLADTVLRIEGRLRGQERSRRAAEPGAVEARSAPVSGEGPELATAPTGPVARHMTREELRARARAKGLIA